MPYAMLGVAVGRVEQTRQATAVATPTGAGTAFVAAPGDSATKFVWGYAAGGGIDYMPLPHVFVRAEYEFVLLNNVLDKQLGINSGRGAVGFTLNRPFDRAA